VAGIVEYFRLVLVSGASGCVLEVLLVVVVRPSIACGNGVVVNGNGRYLTTRCANGDDMPKP
jgi:hypothetical protein